MSSRHQTKSAHAASVLREALSEGRYAAGERLQASRLVRELGLSITPLREALIELANEGLVELAPHRGARVAEIRLADVSDLYAVRALLEAEAAKRAAVRIGPDTIEMLRTIHAGFEGARKKHDGAELRALNDEFHFTIYDACGSPLLRRLIRNVWATAPNDTFDRIPQRAGASARDHARILDALASGDPLAAERAMREHIEEAGALVRRFKSRKPGGTTAAGRPS